MLANVPTVDQDYCGGVLHCHNCGRKPFVSGTHEAKIGRDGPLWKMVDLAKDVGKQKNGGAEPRRPSDSN